MTAEEQDKRVALGCPACERIGLLGGSPYLELEPGARFVDEDGKEKVVVAIKVQLSADAFRCPVCGLRLHGQEQLQEAGLPTQALVRIGSHEDFAAFADDLRFADESNDEGDQGT